MSDTQIIEDIKDAQVGDVLTIVLTGEPWILGAPHDMGEVYAEFAGFHDFDGTVLRVTRIERPIPELPSIPGTRFSAEVTGGRETKRVWLMVYYGTGGLITYVSHREVNGNRHHAKGHIDAATVTHVTLPEED